MKKIYTLFRIFLAAWIFSFVFIQSSWAQVATFNNAGSGTEQSFTFTVPAGVTSITVQAWGGGGGGGGNSGNSNGGGGGGGGAYSSATFTGLIPGTVYNGNVGKSGTTGFGANGGIGGDSWVGSATTIMAKGGGGGTAAGGSGGAAGSGGASGSGYGNIKYSGGNGGAGRTNSTGTGGGGGSSAGTGANGIAGTAGTSSVGAGGIAPTGGGNGGNGGSGSANGVAGLLPGGAGGGSGEKGNNFGTGGNGTAGKVIITWTCPSATISYAGNPFCNSISTPQSATLTGAPGGTFSASPAGLTINASTGAITPSTSTVGLYTVHYQIAADQGCPAVDATTSVNISIPPTTANAGPDQTGVATCGLTTVTLAANTPSAGTGTWSIVSGTGGTVANPSSPTSTFTGTAGNSYTLRWTISSPCAASSDNVVITFNRNPTIANAGSDQDLCNTTTATLAGNTPTIGTGNWSLVSGTAIITTPSSPTSGVSGLVVGSSASLRWTISNNPCIASTDDVIITVLIPPTSSNAGTNQSLCDITTTILEGNTPVLGTGEWTIVAGTATITTPASPTSGVTDLVVGASATLRWTITYGICYSTDDVVISVSSPPSTANAGPDQTDAATCGLTTVTLAGNAPTTGTGAWSIVSGTGGSVAISSNPTSTFTGTTGSTYTLRWTISNSPCTASTDDVVITFNSSPTTSNAGIDQSLCNVTTTTLAGNTPSVGTGTWSVVSGTATITTPASPTSGVTGLVIGTSATLRWTITHAPCTASTDDVVITVSELPSTANAGPDQTDASTCGLTTVTMTGNSPTVGTGLWSVISGTGGSFSNASSPNSNFTGTAGTSYTLRWTISNGSCTATTDDVLVTFNQNPSTANAGPDQTGVSTCGLTTVTLAGNNPTVGTGLWSIVSGSGGSFSNAALYNSTFSGTSGSVYTIAWTISNSQCNSSTDNVNITFNIAPTTANAGPDQTGVTTCDLTTVTLAANTPSIGTGLWSIISGTGGSFANSLDPASTFSGTAGNTYTLRWTISNSPCVSTDEIAVTFNIAPVTTGTTICQGGNGTLTSSFNCPAGATSSVGPRFAGTGATSGSGKVWSNPTRIIADDNSNSTVTSDGSSFGQINNTTQILSATQFGFSIPTNATINGIQVNLGRYANGAGVQDNTVMLIKASNPTGSNLALSNTDWPTSEGAQSYGSTSNLWGTTWTPAEINATNFGVELVADISFFSVLNITRTAYVDYMQITVTYTLNGVLNWYTASTGGSPIGSGSPFNPVGVAGSGLPNTNTPGTYTYYAECSTAPICRTATEFIITPAPTPTISGPATACATSVLTYTTEAGMSGYTWNITGGTGSSTTNAINVTWGTGATGNVNVTYTSSGCGQSTPSDLGVTITPLPTANAGPDATVNQGTAFTVSGATASSSLLLWTSSGPGVLSDETTITPTYTPGASETSAVVLTLYVGSSPCQSSDDMVIYFTPNNATWTGNAYDNDWNTSYNWDVDAVPGAITDVIIPSGLLGNYPTIINDATCNNITIGSDATLVEINSLTVLGTAEVERLIANDWKWHLLSSPVASQPIWPEFSPTPIGGGPAPYTFGPQPWNWDFYYYNAYAGEFNYWVNIRTGGGDYNTGPIDQADENAGFGPVIPEFQIGRGYLVAYTNGWDGTSSSPEIHTFSGALNSGTINIPVVKHTEDVYSTVNLVGNPYPSALDWQAVSGWNRDNLILSGIGSPGYDYWVWNDIYGVYGAFNSGNAEGTGTNGVDRYIAPMQGFFVDVETTGNLVMGNKTRVHSLQPWLKNAEASSAFLKLKLTSNVTSYKDEMVVIFNPDYNGGGTAKWYSMYEETPEICSVKDGNIYCIDRRGVLADGDIINIRTKQSADATYTITAGNIDNFNYSDKVMLEDLKTGITTNLKTTPSYTYTGGPADDQNRFRLVIGAPNAVSEPEAVNFVIYNENGVVNILPKANMSGQVRIIDMAGRLIATAKLVSGSTTRIDMHGQSGVYVVSVIHNKGTSNSKLVIK